MATWPERPAVAKRDAGSPDQTIVANRFLEIGSSGPLGQPVEQPGPDGRISEAIASPNVKAGIVTGNERPLRAMADEDALSR